VRSGYNSFVLFGICETDLDPALKKSINQNKFDHRRHLMGDKGGKKDKNKADKQKQNQEKKKQEQQKSKLPTKKPA